MTTAASVSGFFSGGGKAAKFPTIGTTVTGTITAVHPPEPQTDFTTGAEIPGKTQVRIELDTELRDPAVDMDDGSRTLYVKGWMTGAIGEALRKAGLREPAIGGTLSVTYTGDGTPPKPGFNGPKQYTATYTAEPVTGQFFGGTQAPPAASPTPPAAVPDQAPPGIDPAAWAAMPEAAKKAIATSLASSAPPPF